MSIHHVTAIAGDPQRNLDFYAGTLGLRLVKLTVNFDDPGTYHLYFGDELGRPGSILTFFPWPDGRRGRQGTGQVGTVSLADSAGVARLVDRAAAAARHQVRGADPPVRRAGARRSAIPTGCCSSWSATPRVERVEPWARRPGAGRARRARHPRRDHLGGRRPRARAEFLTRFMGFRAVGRGGQSAPVRVGRRRRGDGGGPSPGAGLLGRRGRRGHRAPRGVPRADRRGAARAARSSSSGRASAITPVVDRQYFQLGLLPRAGRRAVRDRHRSAGLHAGRAARRAGHAAQAAAAATSRCASGSSGRCRRSGCRTARRGVPRRRP